MLLPYGRCANKNYTMLAHAQVTLMDLDPVSAVVGKVSKASHSHGKFWVCRYLIVDGAYTPHTDATHAYYSCV